jgi:hypothetical protein
MQKRPSKGALALTPGSVVVFVKDGQPRHSCVALNAYMLAGYNMLGWFLQGGFDHDYSEHPTSDLRWRGRWREKDVQGNTAANKWCQLVAISEAAAKKVVQKAVNK